MAANLFFHRTQAWTVLAAAACCALLFSAVLADQSATKAAIIAAPGPAPALAPVLAPAPPPKPLTLHDKVVAALRAASHYGALSGLLDSLAESSIIKEGITLFAPDDGAFSGLNMNSSNLLMTTLNYHVATSVYSYNQLSNLPVNSTIQTASPNVLIFITSTGKSGLRLDDSAISDPDIYSDGQVSVQGISTVMNTAKYNKGVLPPAAAPAPLDALDIIPSPAPGIITQPAPKTASPTKSDAAYVMTNVASTMLIVSAVSFMVANLL